MNKLMRNQATKKGKMVKLPKSWVVKQIKETLDLESGVWGKEKEDGYPVLRSTNFTESGYIDFEKVTYRDIPERKIEDKKLKKGDILLEISGGGPQQPVGRVVYFDKNKSEDYLFGNFVKRLRLKKDLFSNNDSYYIFRFLERYYNIGQTETLQHQTTGIRNLDYRAYMSLPLPLPPLPEQKRIASILSSVDAVIEKTEQVIEKTKELKKGLMQKLLTKGIGHSEFKDVRIGPKTINIPNIWDVTSFEKVSNVNQGLQIAISKRSKNPGSNKLKYITVQHLNNPEDSRYEYYINEPRDSVICEKEDILMTRTGNTGEVITDERGVFHNNFFKIDFDREKLNKDYLFYYLNSKFIQHVIKIFAGTTTIPDLNHGDFYSIPVLLPSLEEQKKIASILSSVDKKIEEEQQYKEKLERLKKGLMQKLLTGEVRVNVEQEV